MSESALLSWRDLLAEVQAALPAHEANRVFEAVAGFDRNKAMDMLDDRVPARVVPYCREKVARRVAGEPLQYVLGRWGFRSLDLMVDRRVLIPRPETESVVEAALSLVAGEGAGVGDGQVFVDLGTGSGAIALSLAVEVAKAEVWATDASAEALAVARANLIGIGTFAATRVRLVEGSWFDALPTVLKGRVNLVVSNPPYVADADELPDEVEAWEPTSALRAGPDGLDDIRHIIAVAPHWLAPGGALVVEIAPSQADAVVDLAETAGFATVEIRNDLTGRPRMLVAR